MARCASIFGDHPILTFFVGALVLALILWAVFMTFGLRRLEQREPDPDSTEERRIRRLWRRLWIERGLFPPWWP